MRDALRDAIKGDHSLSSTERVVGIASCGYIDATLGHPRRGITWPTQEDLIADLGFSERTIRRVLNALGGRIFAAAE